MPQVEVVFSQRGARGVQRDIERIGRSSDRSNSALTFLKRSLATLGSAAAAREFLRLSDSFTTAQNQLRVVTGSVEDANGALDELFQIAQRTRAPIEANVQLFQRLSLAQNELGASTRELLTFTEQIGQLLAIQGGSAESARGALLQLSQAFGSGIVRAEEFNSILEGAFPIAQAAARGLDRAGGSVARLRTLIVNGQVTSEEFFRAIQSQADLTEQTFATTNATVGQAFTQLRNNVIQFIGELNNSTRFTEAFVSAVGTISNAVLGAANNIDGFLEVLENLATAFIAIQATRMILFMQTLGRQAVLLSRTLTAVAFSNPFTAIAAAIGIVIGLAFKFRNEVFQLGEAQVSLRDLAAEAFDRIVIGINLAIDAIKDFLGLFGTNTQVVKQFVNDFINGFRLIFVLGQEVFKGLGDLLIGFATGTADAFASLPTALKAGLTGGGLDEINSIISDAFFGGLEEKAGQTFSNIRERALEAFNRDSLSEIAAAFGETEFVQAAAARGAARRGAEIGGGPDDANRAGLPTQPAITMASVDITKQTDALNQLRAELDSTVAAEQDFAEGVQVAAAALQAGVIDAKEYQNILGSLADRLDSEVNAEFEALRGELDPVNTALQEQADSMVILIEAYERGKITLEEFNFLQEQVKIRADEAKTSLDNLANLEGFEGFFAGVQQGFEDFSNSMGSIGEVTANAVSGALDKAATGIAEFVVEGKGSFKDLAVSILKDLQKVFLKLLIVTALKAALSAVGGGIGGAVGGAASAGAGAAGGSIPGLQNGGLAQQGQPRLVGERGPELFVPPTTGQVVPNGALQAAAAPPEVNVQVVNVDDPASVTDAMSSTDGEQVIVNAIQRNRSKVKNIVG